MSPHFSIIVFCVMSVSFRSYFALIFQPHLSVLLYIFQTCCKLCYYFKMLPPVPLVSFSIVFLFFQVPFFVLQSFVLIFLPFCCCCCLLSYRFLCHPYLVQHYIFCSQFALFSRQLSFRFSVMFLLSFSFLLVFLSFFERFRLSSCHVLLSAIASLKFSFFF